MSSRFKICIPVIILVSLSALLFQTHVAGQTNAAGESSRTPGKESSNSDSAKFALVTKALRLVAIAYRYNVRTGESWRNYSTTTKWTKIAETAPIAKGEYEIQIVGPIGPSDKESSMTIRIDREAGRTWYEQNDTWKPHAEPSDKEQPK